MSMSRSMPALAALALSALASPAPAEDGKTMPGSACHARDDAQLRALSRGVGYIFNLGSTPEFDISCPVAKDLNKIRRALVMLRDVNPAPGADISCTLYTLRGDGTAQAQQQLRTEGSFMGAQPLTFGAQAAAVNGRYDLTCDLPPYHPTFGVSAIYNYTVVED